LNKEADRTLIIYR